MISNFQMFVNNFFKFFIKQGYKDSNLEMTESESVALPFGDSPILKRRGWDSNPRALADKRFSRPPRYDHFDTPARERVMGIEPTYPAWKAGVLPLNYTRMRCMKLNTAEQKPLFLFECPVPESNQRHEDFQSSALPTELTGHKCFRIELRE